MAPDFEACGNAFLNHSTTLYKQYLFNGSVSGLSTSSRTALITLDGCKQLCGSGIAYYPWKDTANTITTWVLPIIGLVVQAPWESNQAWETILSLFRYLGSPMAALAYVFWNIKVTGKCAMMIDMSTRYDEYPDEDSDFSKMRDSMFILCIMNQYSIKPSLPHIESELLLRLALFSNLLQLKDSDDARDSIVTRRTELARNLREGRKKGVIPIFISFLWFVFALALTIELAFDDIGGNETAHNLALGLMVCWLPVLIVATAVDRNSVSADSIEQRLNELLEDVRHALTNSTTLRKYKQMTNSQDDAFAWTAALHDNNTYDGEFFVSFGGQGREHFHYGVAHPILSAIETTFMAEYGRDWLRHGFAARVAMVGGSRNISGLKSFDPRMIWQVVSSLTIVCGSVFGAFILSWFTPTVGLGCRTGGYLVYLVLALGLLVIEMGVWRITHQYTHTSHDLIRRVGSRLERVFTGEKGFPQNGYKRRIVLYLHSTAFRDVIKNVIVRPLEACNTIWFCYITCAQTFGSYQTCECMSSNWANGEGGFIDFQTANFYAANGVYVYWSAGTAVSCITMVAGLLYIVNEYCTQSHLATEHYGRAMQGLKMTRWYKKHTRFARFVPNQVLRFGKFLGWKMSGGKTRHGRRSLVWTVEARKRTSLEVFNIGQNP